MMCRAVPLLSSRINSQSFDSTAEKERIGAAGIDLTEAFSPDFSAYYLISQSLSLLFIEKLSVFLLL